MASKNEQKIQKIVDALASKGIIASGGGATITGNQIASTIIGIVKRTNLTTTSTNTQITVKAERGYYPSNKSYTIEKYTGNYTVQAGVNSTTIPTYNKYMTNNITIRGDSNLIPANIRNGTTIFGVTGTYTGTQIPIAYVRGSIKSSSPASIIYYNTTDDYNVYYNIMQYAEAANQKVPLHSLLVYASANSTAPPYYNGLNLLNSSAQSTPRIFVFEVTSDFNIER